MAKNLAGVGLRGKSGKSAKRSGEHPDDGPKAEKDNDEQNVKAQDEDEEEETAKSKSARSEAKAVRAASAKATAKAHKIAVLCKLAGRPELTDECIASGASAAAVGEHLLGLRADSSSGEIAGHTSPAGSPAATAAMWDHACKKNARFFGHA